MEYLRFLEQTGHPFRIINVTNTLGLESTVKILSPYYPHGCLMNILNAQDSKIIKYLFGRSRLSAISMDVVDNEAREYIKILKTVINNVESNNNYFNSKSIYEHSAIVLPEIIARFCYKCSVDVLDEIFNITFELCVNNIRSNFRKLNKLLKAVMLAYTPNEQKDRINKILEFPMEIDKINDYYDPVVHIKIPKSKYSLNPRVYNSVIGQIKHLLDKGDDDNQKIALNRLLILSQIIELRDEEKKLLCCNLVKNDSLEKDYLLFVIDKVKFNNNAVNVYEKTMNMMKGHSNKGVFYSGSENYVKLIDIIKDINIEKMDIVNSFDIMIKLVENNITWIKNGDYEAKERVKQSFIIAISLLAKRKQRKLELQQEEKEIAIKYFKALEKAYNTCFAFNIVKKYFVEKSKFSYAEIKREIWLATIEELDLLKSLYNVLHVLKYDIRKDICISKCTDIIYDAVVFEVVNSKGEELEKILALIQALINNNILNKRLLYIIDVALLKMIDRTCIENDDTEQDALKKLKCRILACKIAKKLFLNGIELKSIDEWKRISQNSNEFIEIRCIEFEEDVYN